MFFPWSLMGADLPPSLPCEIGLIGLNHPSPPIIIFRVSLHRLFCWFIWVFGKGGFQNVFLLYLFMRKLFQRQTFEAWWWRSHGRFTWVYLYTTVWCITFYVMLRQLHLSWMRFEVHFDVFSTFVLSGFPNPEF